jgi:hypothetical protein
MNDQRKSDAAGKPVVELEGVREDSLRLSGPKASRRIRELAARGQVAYIYAIDSPRSRAGDAEFVDRRIGDRRGVRLQSGKLLDMRRRFLCECLVRDRSPTGLRLALGRECRIPNEFYFFDDETQALVRLSVAWRRSLTVGVRMVCNHAEPAIESQVRAIMRGKFYAIPD